MSPFQHARRTSAPVLAGLGLRSDDGIGPVHLAYVAAAVLLPARLLVILRAAAEVPDLQARMRDWLTSDQADLESALKRSSNPYAELARLVTGATQAGRPELEESLARAQRKAKRRSDRGQALDAASLVLLLGLTLTGGRAEALESSWLGQWAVWGVAFIAVILLATMMARAALQRRLEAAVGELGQALLRRPISPSLSGACAFCGADTMPVAVEVQQDGVTSRVVGALCRNCGKVVASLPPN